MKNEEYNMPTLWSDIAFEAAKFWQVKAHKALINKSEEMVGITIIGDGVHNKIKNIMLPLNDYVYSSVAWKMIIGLYLEPNHRKSILDQLK